MKNEKNLELTRADIERVAGEMDIDLALLPSEKHEDIVERFTDRIKGSSNIWRLVLENVIYKFAGEEAILQDEEAESNNMLKERKIAMEILGEFEELLAENGIQIPSEDREGREEETYLYGNEYCRLEDKIALKISKHLPQGD